MYAVYELVSNKKSLLWENRGFGNRAFYSLLLVAYVIDLQRKFGHNKMFDFVTINLFNELVVGAYFIGI